MTDEKIIEITDPSTDRYASLRLIDWWEQQRLAEAHVMVIGAGALGNEVLKTLALLGVGHLVIVDFDTIEMANLSRSVLFRAEDVGRPKVEVAAERLQQINPQVGIAALHGNVRHAIGLGVFRRMDVIIGCLDNREARRFVNLACWRVGKPWIDGALDRLDGLVRVFDPREQNSACYECTLTEADYALLNQRYSCPPGMELPGGRYPTTPTAAAIIGALQVQEAVKLLHGIAVPAGRVTYYSGQSLLMTPMRYPVREDCPAHDRYETIIELPGSASTMTAGELHAAITAQLGVSTMVVLNEIIVAGFYCTHCQQLEPVYLPYAAIQPGSFVCPQCGAARTINTTTALRGQGPIAAIPLTQLAIPPLAILTVRTADAEYYIELSHDTVPYHFKEERTHATTSANTTTKRV